MEILADEFRIVESDSERKGLRESLMFFVNHMCCLQESNIILWWKEVHTSRDTGERA